MGKTKIKKVEEVTPEVPVKQESPVVEEKKTTTEARTQQSKASKKQGEPKQRSKKYQQVLEKVEKSKNYPLKEAVELSQQTSYSKFPGTLEIHINTNASNIRGLVNMPFMSGKQLKVLAFGKGAKEAGADIEGTESTIDEISKGKIDFDVIVVTPDWMSKLAKVARILGPKGLMPNPKNGTISDNLEKAITDLKGGKTEYKTEAKGQVIHLAIGKVNQSSDEIQANVKALYTIIGRSKIKKITLSPSMGLGVKVDLSSIA